MSFHSDHLLLFVRVRVSPAFSLALFWWSFTQIRSWLPAAKTITDILAFCEFSFGADITDPPGPRGGSLSVSGARGEGPRPPAPTRRAKATTKNAKKATIETSERKGYFEEWPKGN